MSGILLMAWWSYLWFPCFNLKQQ